MGFRRLRYRIVSQAVSVLLRRKDQLARALCKGEYENNDGDYMTFDETDAAIADFYARHAVTKRPYDYQAREGEEVTRIQALGLEPFSIVVKKQL